MRAQLDEEAFAEAWEAGAKLSLDEAVALALGEAELDVTTLRRSGDLTLIYSSSNLNR